jgi:hypothetical protein
MPDDIDDEQDDDNIEETQVEETQVEENIRSRGRGRSIHETKIKSPKSKYFGLEAQSRN